jgi:hypothetical protein
MAFVQIVDEPSTCQQPSTNNNAANDTANGYNNNNKKLSPELVGKFLFLSLFIFTEYTSIYEWSRAQL